MNDIEIQKVVKHLNADGTVNHYKVDDVLIVPEDPANRHYAEIMRQVEAGTLTILAAD